MVEAPVSEAILTLIETAKRNSNPATRMALFDALPPPIRKIANERGLNAAVNFWMQHADC